MVGRLKAYMTVVSAIGFVVLFVLAANVDLDQVRDSLPAGALLALVVLVAPFLSIPISRDGPSTTAPTRSAWPPGPPSGWPWPAVRSPAPRPCPRS